MGNKFLVTAVVAAAMSSTAGAQKLDQLYEAAKKEGTLVLVGGGPAPP